VRVSRPACERSDLTGDRGRPGPLIGRADLMQHIELLENFEPRALTGAALPAEPLATPSAARRFNWAVTR